MSTTSADAAGRGTRHAGAFKTIATIAATAVAGLAITSSGVYALLKAQAFNGTAEQVNSGTLLLTLTDSASSAGFSQNITNLAPGDVITRFVQVANTGSLDGTNLSLQLSDQAAVTALTTDATNGLQVNVQSCTVAWAWTPTGTPSCSGTTGSATGLPAATFKGTAQSMGAGSFVHGTTQYYKVAVSLPSTINETSVNGVAPVGSIQGLTSSLRWTFSLDQRAATSLNS